MGWAWVGEQGPLCRFPFWYPAQGDERSDWEKLLDKHVQEKINTYGYKNRVRIEVNLRMLKG